MNKINHLLLITFCLSLFACFFFPPIAFAAYTYNPMEPIPGFESAATDFPSYILAIYKFGIWTVGIAALLMISIGGFMYFTSAGNTSKMDQAKTIIWDALFGLIVAMAAYLLLYVINPDLVKVNVSLKAVSPAAALPPSPPSPPPVAGVLSCSASANLPETETVLSCIKTKALIASVTTGEIKTYQGSHTCNLTSSPPSISCHYGGRDCNGRSNAIDFGGPAGSGGGYHYARLVQFGNECGAYISRCEDANGIRKDDCNDVLVNHVHITVLGICGCR